MSNSEPLKRGRGRPPKQFAGEMEGRDLLVRKGMELLTEKGFISTGISELLEGTDIPKGSFYHYFKSKDAFGLEVLEAYGRYFDHLLDGYLLAEDVPPLKRLQNFMDGAIGWIERHEFRRGCLIGNMGQEASGLNAEFSERLEAVFEGWQNRIARCLDAAQVIGDLSPDIETHKMATFFWIGWEGAILRAKLVKSTEPLNLFREVFFSQLKISTQ
ncbi:TetR/AcrR family transcriptional regulator [Sneathiella limimaris]|uniref:acrylate utilization transcriptional regulator AcuR n=1 Tax=Sneathiella limimaris TaxID=1964213 RepID=UPI00146EBCEE|nr:TetR/AcrR family transcriptional regulator [Sneathiella limimaris]